MMNKFFYIFLLLSFGITTNRIHGQNALNFDGVNDQIMGPNSAPTLATNSFTVEAWVNPTASYTLDAETTTGYAGVTGTKAYLLYPPQQTSDAGVGIAVGTNGIGVYELADNHAPCLLSWAGSVSGWTHIAVVCDNRQYKLYVNSTLVRTGLTSIKPNTVLALGTASNHSSIGTGPSGYYQGSLDEFRVWNRVLAQCEIQAHKDCELGTGQTGLQAYYKFNQSSGTSLTDDSGNNNTCTLSNFALTGTTSNWITTGGVTTGTTCTALPIPSVSITANPSGTITAGTSVTFTPTPTNGGTTPQYQWKNGSTTVGTGATYTSSTLANGDVITCVLTPSAEICPLPATATSTGITMSVTGTLPGAALNFDGTNDYVDCSNAAALQLTTGTIETWIKTSNAGSNFRGLIVKQQAYGLFLNDNVLVAFDWAGGGITTTNINLADGLWHHVAMSFQNGVANGSKIYIDGVLKTTMTYTVFNQTIGLALGAGQTTVLQNFNGNMDEVRIWNRVLPQCEIQNNMNCELGSGQTGLQAYYKFNKGEAASDNAGVTTLTDATGNDNTGTLTNFTLTGTTSNWVATGGVTTGTTCTALLTPSVSIAVTAGSQTPCSNGSVTFTATPTNGGTTPTYQWQKNGVNVGTNINTYTNATWSTTSNDVINCIITNNDACASTATSNSLTITTNNPTIAITGATSACSSVSLTATGGFMYAWSGGNSPSSATNMFTTSGTYTVSVTNTLGCVGTASQTVTVNTPPTVSISNTGATACLGTAALSLNSSNTASQIQWYNGATLVNTATSTPATTGTTVAGGFGSNNNQLDSPSGIYVDALGNTYVADKGNNRIQKFAAGATTATTVAGGNGGGSADNQVFAPSSVYVDAVGNVYVAEEVNHRISKWAPGATTGITVATTGFLGTPSGVYVDAAGNIYVADKSQHRIQKWTPGATTGTTVAGDNGDGSAANQLDNPSGIYVDASGNIYICDQYNHRIQKWAAGATTGTTVAGGNGNGSNANQLFLPSALYVDAVGNIYVSDQNNFRIQKFAAGSTTGTTVAGGNGPGSAANQLYYPGGVYLDPTGNIYIADAGNSRIQKWGSGAAATTYTPTTAGSYTAFVTDANGCTATTTAFAVNATVTPSVSIAVTAGSQTPCPNGSVTFTATPTNGGTTPTYQWQKNGANVGTNSNTYTNATWSTTSNDVITCIMTSNAACATTTIGTSNSLAITANNGTIAAITGVPIACSSVSLTATGGFMYAWSGGNSPSSATNTFTTSGTYTVSVTNTSGCVGTASQAVTVNAPPTVSISNTGATACLGTAALSLNSSNTVSQIQWYNGATLVNTATPTPATTGTTVAGGNGNGSAANQLGFTSSVYVDAAGNIYVADGNNNRIQKFAAGSTTGITVAGGNGRGSAANQLDGPNAVYVDGSGNIYISDGNNNRIQKWAAGATTGTTVAGGNGQGSAANQFSSTSIYVDGSGNIYIADRPNNRIQKWAVGATTGTTVAGGNGNGAAANQLAFPLSVYVDGSGNIYIADFFNNRIQKWAPNANTASVGTTVAGGNGKGPAANQLAFPYAVFVDGSGNIYVADQSNDRIQKWAAGATTGTTVAGGNGNGSAANQLANPSSVYVDGSGNIYISDLNNNRIQKWGSSTVATTYTPITAGSYTALVTDANTCTATTTAFAVNGVVPPAVFITANPSGVIIAGTSVTFTATPTNGGATPQYQWKKGNTDVGTGATYTSSTLANGDVITCVLTPSADICTLPETATSSGIAMVVNPATVTPSVSIAASATTICAGTSVTFTATPTNGGGTPPPTYQWKNGSANVGTNSATYTTTALGNGDIITCVMTSSLSNASPTTATSADITMTVNSVPVVAAISGNTSLNIGANTTLSSTTSGGVWSSSNSAIATVSTTGVVTGVAGGSVTISYAITNGCGTTTVTQAMTVSLQTYCLTYKPVRTGNYVDVHISLVASGSAFNLGDANLQFRYKSAVLSNPTLQTDALTPTGRYDVVLAPVIPPLGFPSDDALITFNSVFNGTSGQGFPISTSETEIAVIRFNIENTNLSPNIRPYENGYLGMVVFDDTPTLLASTGTCGAYDFALSTNFTYSTSAFCKSATPQAVTLVGTSGGTYSSTTGLSLDATTGQITPSTSTAGTYVVTYSIPSVGGGQAVTTVTINALPIPSIVDLNAAYCKNVAAVTLVGNPVGGSFTIDGTTATSLDPSLLTANTHTVVYSYTDANMCSATATQSVLINTIPVITAQPMASTTVCLGSAINLGVTATGTGLMYQWKKGSNLIAGANAATYEISAAVLGDAATYSVEVSGTCSPNVVSENAVVAINTLPAAITGTPSVNETFTTTLSNAVSGGTWSSSNIAVATVNPTTGVVTGVHAGTATITYSLTNACGTNTVTQVVTVIRNTVVVGLKVFLQGPYSTTNGYMNDYLRINGRVPTVEPYTGMTGFTHKGDGGGEVINNSVLAVTGVNAIADWVFIELRSKTSPTTILSTRSALIQRDGDVVDLDGTSPVTFNDVIADDYYIAVRHRNHLGFRTSTPQTLTSTATNINFTNGSKTTAGTNALKTVGGVYLMYCSDGDGNGVINAIDKNKVWLIQNGLSGYLKGDFDMNGVVNAIDINLFWLPNNSKIQQLDF